MYKYILFDIDNTLYDFTAAEDRSIRETFRAFGIPVTEENVQTYSRINLSFWKRLERKEITKAQLWGGRFVEFGNTVGFPIDTSLADAINTYYLEALARCAILISGAEELCQTLIARGYKLYAVTNGNASVQHSRLEERNFKQYFCKLFISEEMGVSKPSPEYFDRVVEAVGSADRSEYLVIGDSLTSDITGGKNSGIDTCWYNPRGEENDKGPIPTYTVKSYGEITDLLK